MCLSVFSLPLTNIIAFSGESGTFKTCKLTKIHCPVNLRAEIQISGFGIYIVLDQAL